MNTTTNEEIAVIDLGTIMPVSALFDIEDSIHSACSNSFADETDENKIFLNLKLTKSYLRGYHEEISEYLTPTWVSVLLGKINALPTLAKRFKLSI